MRVARRLVFAFALLILTQELLLRAVFPVPEVSNFDRARYAPLGIVPDPEAPPSLAHASFTWVSEPDGFEFVHRLNLHGFRDGEWPLAPPPRATRIAFVGDSFVEGFSTGEDGTIPLVFEALAAGGGLSVDALNLGVGGADLAAYARLLRDAVPLLRPRDVILVLYANDVIPLRFDPAWLETPLAPDRASAWTPRLALVLRRVSEGLPVPRRWHAAPIPFLPAAPDPRNPWSDGRRAGRLGAFVAPRSPAPSARAASTPPSPTSSRGSA
jgi:lysophospholipase L1-like esterase